MLNKIIATVAIILAVLAIAISAFSLGRTPVVSELGGTTHASWSAASFKVGSTEVISSARDATLNSVDTGTLVQGGVITTINTATTTLTAAQVCDSSVIKLSYTNATTVTHDSGLVTMASSSAVIADCLPTVGDSKKLLFWNFSTTTFGLTFQEWASTSATVILRNATSSAFETFTNINLAAGRYMIAEYLNLTGSTSTITFVPLQGN